MRLIKSTQPTLFHLDSKKELSETSFVHEPSISIEQINPNEAINGGASLLISYSFAESPFGKIIIASTQKGICYLAFIEDEEKAFTALASRFPNAHYSNTANEIQQNALLVFQPNLRAKEVKLHLSGTPFQLKVWEILLKIPMGYLSTYGEVAKEVENPSASRAVGSAIGKNPIAFIVPCHRVIQTSGKIGGYMWGNSRKTKIIDWEAKKKNA